MIMNETMALLLAAVAGLCLGSIFYGGLWYTVRKGVTAKQPALWFLGSLLVRMSLVLVGIYFIGGNSWQRMLACLLGFIAARWLVVWLTRPHIEKPYIVAKESRHAT